MKQLEAQLLIRQYEGFIGERGGPARRPGAGKGSQAPLLADRLGIPVVATGDLFRAAVRDGTALGMEARRYMDAGQLVPDDITVRLLLDRLGRADAAHGVILDGFPRTAIQADALDSALEGPARGRDRGRPGGRPGRAPHQAPLGPLDLQGRGPPLPRDGEPAAGGGVCDLDGSELYQRADDRPDTIRARMAQQLGALDAGHRPLPGRGKLHTVDGEQPIAAVGEDINRVLTDAGVTPVRLT